MEEIREEKGRIVKAVAAFCEEAASLLLMAYLFIIFCMYPFYMRQGYVDIGDAKFAFYRDMTIGAICLIVPLVLIFKIAKHCMKKADKKAEQINKENQILKKSQNLKWLTRIRNVSVTDGLMLLYLSAVLLSYFYSEFRQQAFWGENGWNMGLVTQLLFIATYYLISRYWEYNGRILLAFAAAAGLVFGIGILNRFSIFPFKIEGANSSFLSTLGNINWYSGFWSVVFGGALFWYWSEQNKIVRAGAGLFLLLCSAAGVSQGSNSAFLSVGALFFLLFILSVRQIIKLRRFLEASMIFCLSCQLLRFWRVMKPEAFDYYDGTLSDQITLSPITLYCFVGLGIIYCLLFVKSLNQDVNLRKFKMLAQITLLLFFIGAGVYLLLLILNSNIEGGIRFMGVKDQLIFSKNWGSSRGGTWIAGAKCYQNMSPSGRLIGAGPDCFALEAYQNPELAKVLRKQFGNARLTNAHNEWLTILVNCGMLGLIGYAGIFITAFWRFLRNAGKKQCYRILYILMAMLFSYTIHNVVSFQQILSTPFVFLAMGIGERVLREKTGSSLNAGNFKAGTVREESS